MKRVLLFILSLQPVISVNAQQITYQPWHGTTSTWVYHHGIADGLGGQIESYTRYVWSGDTLINNVNYTRMFASSNGLDPYAPMFTGRAFREDTLTHEQFVIDMSGVERNITINQLLHVGDTVLVTDGVYYGLTLMTSCNNLEIGHIMTVLEVDSTLVDNQEYRSNYFFEIRNESNDLVAEVSYDSGIGVTGYITFEFGSSMLCYREDNNPVDFGGNFPPWYNSCNALVEENKMEVSASPNPSNDVIQVSSSEKIQSVVIYNLLGEFVLSAEPFSEQFSIHLNETGIYLCEITGISGKKSIHKLIKN